MAIASASGHDACLASRSNARGSGRGLEATIPAKSQGQPSARLAVSGIPPSAHRCGCKLCGAWGSLKLEARLPLWCSRSAPTASTSPAGAHLQTRIGPPSHVEASYIWMA